ncbi:hypothetical protein A2W14_02240 [Candidatus Gottesmanbacteria bacterium RBG_16_37_8]|uniref:3-keto-5-aminohexanoate cleavage protein n=1 Tax=Candidatus Gottesmanbacteria bacterium RBG_16_37_8 TaxID=1798371 RepID=A0A1F5YRI2_9BACT|nr:MAG: hypothetical protein A2W14_02240 [Candidatus Gottesmanbacteria bacterium RBG_16_37_8]
MINEPLIINVCLTGNVPTYEDNPHVPLSAAEIIKDAKEVIKTGATFLHLHARDKNGKPTYDKKVFSKIIEGIRKINDKVIICVSTSGRIFRDFDKRTQVLELTNGVKPDFASLTLGSFNFPKEECINSPETIRLMAQMMKEKNILPEWEIFEPGMLHYGQYLTDKGFLDQPKWINIFLGSLGTSPFTKEAVNLYLSMLKPNFRFALTGVGRFQYDANLTSLDLGGHVRVGLEDSFFMDKEKKDTATNVRLVTRIVKAAKDKGRKIADINLTRKLLLS